MASEEPSPASAEPDRPDVGTGRGDSRWSVARLRWKALLPELPDDVIALIATPIVVSVDPPGIPRRVEDDDDKEEQQERYPAPVDPCAVLRIRYGDRRPGFLTPAGLGPTAAARHRV
jgi:hypothetical protein